MSDPYSVDLAACKCRQQRLLSEIRKCGIGLAILTRSQSVQWLTGAYVGPLFPLAAAMDADGKVVLVLPSRKVEIAAAADSVHAYEEKRLSTMRDASEMQAACISVLLDNLPGSAGKAGCEFSAANLQLTSAWPDDWLNLDTMMATLRRAKDADELRMLARANQANQRMYEVAREIIEPGLNEIDLFNALQSAAVKELGEPLTYIGQDFRCAARGGAPRDRACQAGELYILDLGVGFRGYYSDNARTIAVSGEPTDLQQQAWQHIAGVFEMVQNTIRPGASCKALYKEAKSMLAAAEPCVFNHHLGHGVGLSPHEGPRLNPNWDDTFAEGDFVAVEPGLYHEDLQLGMRLENNYLVTADGCQLLTDWPLELA